MSKPNGVLRCLLWLFAALAISLSPARLVAQGSREEAKKEGKVVYYTTMNMSETAKLVNAFKKKYPFIKVKVYRSGDEALLTKIETEARLHRHFWDVVAITGFAGYHLYRKGFYAKYRSPERKFFAKGFKDREGYWTSIYTNTHVLAYNTALVPKDQAPKSYRDLLNPKWKGKMALDAKDFEWFANMIEFLGREKGIAFMKKLAAQELRMERGHTLLTQLVAAGELSMGIAMYGHRVESMKSRGAPLDWVGLNPVVANIHPVALSAKAPDPNAGRLLIDFLLSREAGKIIQRMHRIPDRTDVAPDPPSLVEGVPILPSDLSLVQNYNSYIKLFRQIFGM